MVSVINQTNNITFSKNEPKTHKMCGTADKLDIRFKRLLILAGNLSISLRAAFSALYLLVTPHSIARARAQRLL